ncbi:hypothetical protein [Kitasatospora sp. NPDC056184]|uniref:hypothetical protein n=1 Tax=Kitasatospora sp. NPDC056184 TaxID=3345738 RepID=UPI0035DEE149
MFQYRVVKHSPEQRAGTMPSWIGYSDIGESFGGEVLTRSEYEETERRYLEAARRFAATQGVTTLRVDGLEIYSESPWWQRIDEGDRLSFEQALELARSILRGESVWCRLVNDGKFFVHFGYDYYMYIGIANPSDDAVLSVRKSGLFVDDFESPYLT